MRFMKKNTFDKDAVLPTQNVDEDELDDDLDEDEDDDEEDEEEDEEEIL